MHVCSFMPGTNSEGVVDIKTLLGKRQCVTQDLLARQLVNLAQQAGNTRYVPQLHAPTPCPGFIPACPLKLSVDTWSARALHSNRWALAAWHDMRSVQAALTEHAPLQATSAGHWGEKSAGELGPCAGRLVQRAHSAMVNSAASRGQPQVDLSTVQPRGSASPSCSWGLGWQ